MALILAIRAAFPGPETNQKFSVGLKEAQLVAGKKGKVKGINMEFELSSDFVLSGADVYYRIRPETSFTRARLKRTPRLRYSTTVPCNDPCLIKVEYYTRLRPEGAPEVSVGSVEKPFILDCADLPKVEEVGLGKLKTFIIVLAIIGAVLGGAGVARGP